MATTLSAADGSALGDDAPVTASLARVGGPLTVRVTGARQLGEHNVEGMEDHVGALGGTITFAGDTIVCELPCG